MNHFTILQQMPGRCDMCKEYNDKFAKLAVDGYAVHPWNICQKCLETTSEAMKLIISSNDHADAAKKMQI